MALTQISTQGIKDGTITGSDLADQSVTLAKLPHGTSSNDGKFLRANNGADPTFETVSSVGGSTGVDFNDNVKARFGTGNDLEIFHDSNDSIINDGGTGDLKFQVGGSTKFQSYFVSGETGGLKLDGTVLKFEGISQSSDQPNVNTGNPSMMWVFDEELNIAGYGKINFIEQGFTRWSINNGALHPHATTYNNLGNSSNRVGNAYIQTSVDLIDNAKLLLGSSDDLQIYHDGSNSFIEDSGTGSLMIESNSVIRLRDNTGNVDFAKFINGGGVELYHNNIKRLDTTSGGINVVGNVKADGIRLDDNDEIRVGTGDDLKIYHDGSNSYIRDEGTGNLNIDSTAGAVKLRTNSTENSIICNENGDVELYYDNSKKLETYSGGVIIYGRVAPNEFQISDNEKAYFGTGNDLQIFHDGTENFLNANSNVIIKTQDGENMAKFLKNSGVELYNDNVKKFATGGSGVYHDNNGTLSQNAIHFERGQNTGDYSTIFGVTNYPDGGYSGQGDGFWAGVHSKGGMVVVLNTDGGRNDGRNNYDHFSVYTKANNSTQGKRAFSVDHTGGIQCGKAGINIDREWENQPSFSMTRDCNDGTNNTDNNAYFRFHGTGRTHAQWTGGSSGSDFSANMLLDGGNYNTSDRRAKTDIVDCPYGLDVVNKLKPRKYQLVNSQLEPQGDDNINLGFIAQEIMEHIPECVNYLGDEANKPNEKGWARAYALDTNEIVAVLTKAIQELAAKVAVLESKT